MKYLIKLFFISCFLLFSLAQANELEFSFPQNAYEAELNADNLEKIFYQRAADHNLSNPQGEAALLFLYTGDTVPDNLRWIASVLSSRGIWVKFQKVKKNFIFS